MESKSHALIAGIFSLLLIALATALGLWLGKDGIVQSPYTIVTGLKVSGLNVQASVRYKGLKVGKVTSIDFDTKNPGLLILQLDIASGTPVTQSTYATLGYQGVTGIASVDLDDDGSKPQSIRRDAKGKALIPLRPGLFQELETRGMAILAQTEEITKRLNLLLDKENRDSLFSTVKQIGRTAAAWEAMPAKLDPILTSLPKVVDQAQESFAAFKLFSDSAKVTSNNLNQVALGLQGENGSFNKLARTVDQLSFSIQNETLADINGLTQDARSTLRSINRVAENLNERPQSLLFGAKAAAPGPGEAGFTFNARPANADIPPGSVQK